VVREESDNRDERVEEPEGGEDDESIDCTPEVAQNGEVLEDANDKPPGEDGEGDEETVDPRPGPEGGGGQRAAAIQKNTTMTIKSAPLPPPSPHLREDLRDLEVDDEDDKAVVDEAKGEEIDGGANGRKGEANGGGREEENGEGLGDSGEGPPAVAADIELRGGGAAAGGGRGAGGGYCLFELAGAEEDGVLDDCGGLDVALKYCQEYDRKRSEDDVDK
jgi:hypothetical protein